MAVQEQRIVTNELDIEGAVIKISVVVGDAGFGNQWLTVVVNPECALVKMIVV